MGERRQRWREGLARGEIEQMAPEIRSVADSGEADGLLMLGMVLQSCGIGPGALEFFHKGAEAGSAIAMFLTGKHMLASEADTDLLVDYACAGKVTGDAMLALQWFERAEAAFVEAWAREWEDEQEARFGAKYLRACVLVANPAAVCDAELALTEAYRELSELHELHTSGALPLTTEQRGMLFTKWHQCCEGLAKATSSEAQRGSFVEEAAQYKKEAAKLLGEGATPVVAAPQAYPAACTPVYVDASSPPDAAAGAVADAVDHGIVELQDNPYPEEYDGAPVPAAAPAADASTASVEEIVEIPPKPVVPASTALTTAAAPPASAVVRLDDNRNGAAWAPGVGPGAGANGSASNGAAPQHFSLHQQHLHVQAGVSDAEVLSLLQQQQHDINVLKAVVERQSQEMTELRERVVELEAGRGGGAARSKGGDGFQAGLLPPHAFVASDGRTFFCRKGSPGTCAVAGLPLRATDTTTFTFTVDAKDGCWGVVLGVVPKELLKGATPSSISPLKPGSMPASWAVDNCKKLICQTYAHKTHPTSWGSSWIKAGSTIQVAWNGPLNTITFTRTAPKELGAKAGFGFHNLSLDPQREWVPAVWVEASFCDVSVTLTPPTVV